MAFARTRWGRGLVGALAAVGVTAAAAPPARAVFPPTLLEPPTQLLPPPPPPRITVPPAEPPPVNPPPVIDPGPPPTEHAPEPATLVTGLVGAGLAGLFGLWRRQRSVVRSP